MGFPRKAVLRAIKAMGDSATVEAIVGWLLEHTLDNLHVDIELDIPMEPKVMKYLS